MVEIIKIVNGKSAKSKENIAISLSPANGGYITVEIQNQSQVQKQ